MTIIALCRANYLFLMALTSYSHSRHFWLPIFLCKAAVLPYHSDWQQHQQTKCPSPSSCKSPITFSWMACQNLWGKSPGFSPLPGESPSLVPYKIFLLPVAQNSQALLRFCFSTAGLENARFKGPRSTAATLCHLTSGSGLSMEVSVEGLKLSSLLHTLPATL